MLDFSDGRFREHFNKSALHLRTALVGRLVYTLSVQWVSFAQTVTYHIYAEEVTD